MEKTNQSSCLRFYRYGFCYCYKCPSKCNSLSSCFHCFLRWIFILFTNSIIKCFLKLLSIALSLYFSRNEFNQLFYIILLSLYIAGQVVTIFRDILLSLMQPINFIVNGDDFAQEFLEKGTRFMNSAQLIFHEGSKKSKLKMVEAFHYFNQGIEVIKNTRECQSFRRNVITSLGSKMHLNTSNTQFTITSLHNPTQLAYNALQRVKINH